MTEIIERTAHGAVFEDDCGDRRFVLLECPACGVQFVHEEDLDDPSAVLAATRGRVDHIGSHTPEDFGLAPLRTESYQQTLLADGGERP